MALTRIDCTVFRAPDQPIDRLSHTLVNPNREPGCLVGAVAAAVRSGLGGQVACKMALEQFISSVLDRFESERGESNGQGPIAQLSLNLDSQADTNLKILEGGFRQANRSVYEFGHRLSAGGRLAAAMIGLVVRDDVMAVGRVGSGSAFLFRKGELFPFFVEHPKDSTAQKIESNFVGSNSLVNVELASVPIEESDLILVLDRAPSAGVERETLNLLKRVDFSAKEPALTLAKEFQALGHEPSFLLLAHVGPKAIYLAEAV